MLCFTNVNHAFKKKKPSDIKLARGLKSYSIQFNYFYDKTTKSCSFS